jgi:hypothetical protein
MDVCSSTEMGEPDASHLGTGGHGPKTDRSRPRSVPVNGLVAMISRIVGHRESGAERRFLACFTFVVQQSGSRRVASRGHRTHWVAYFSSHVFISPKSK